MDLGLLGSNCMSSTSSVKLRGEVDSDLKMSFVSVDHYMKNALIFIFNRSECN